MYKIRTYNAISVKGLDRFPRAQFEVGSDVAHPDAFLLPEEALDTPIAAHPEHRDLEAGRRGRIQRPAEDGVDRCRHG